MTDSRFPIPFAGIANTVFCGSRNEMLELVAYLSGVCGHCHAIAVFTETNAVHMSDSARECCVALISGERVGTVVLEGGDISAHDEEVRDQVLSNLAAHFDRPYVLWSSRGAVIVSHLGEREHTPRLVDWLGGEDAADIARQKPLD